MPKPGFSCFAATAPGVEAVCAAELSALGVRAKVEDGGVAWSGTLESIAKANLWLRTASRVLVRAARFRATAFYELERHANGIAWSEYMNESSAVAFRVTCRKSKLYHSDAVAQRFAEAVQRRIPGVRIEGVGTEDDDDASQAGDRQLFVVRFVHDVCTVSADTSGALLHRRGYRQQLAKAPLRETLAAAVVLGAGWTGRTPLTDPMCGSGTIPIEAALIARRMAPGRERSFAFLKWPSADTGAWKRLLAEARARALPSSPVAIVGSDRDAGAIAAAIANAERAGVASDIHFATKPISAIDDAAGEAGLVAVNPPYGVRIGVTAALRDLYARLGDVLRIRRPGWTLALLSADRALERQLRLPLEERFATRNGGIAVRLMVARLPTADRKLKANLKANLEANL